ncbi:MAG: hypothetical protein VR64_13370 [Desulfatitalea sp. BRH_c12]|nr:MAG: hypothetical protein VR64_13370 [Desulfatitalea sp. BRH_c12]
MGDFLFAIVKHNSAVKKSERTLFIWQIAKFMLPVLNWLNKSNHVHASYESDALTMPRFTPPYHNHPCIELWIQPSLDGVSAKDVGKAPLTAASKGVA